MVEYLIDICVDINTTSNKGSLMKLQEQNLTLWFCPKQLGNLRFYKFQEIYVHKVFNGVSKVLSSLIKQVIEVLEFHSSGEG